MISFGHYLDGTKSNFVPTETRPRSCQHVKRRFLKCQLAVLCPEHGVQAVIDVIDLADQPGKYIADTELACHCVKEIEVSCKH